MCPREECRKVARAIRQTLRKVKRLRLSTPHELSAMNRKVVVRLERVKAIDEAALARKNSTKERSDFQCRFSDEGHVIVPLVKRSESTQDESEKKRSPLKEKKV